MYSLRFQLILAILFAAAGGAAAVYFYPSPLETVMALSAGASLSYCVLYFFVYRPLMQFQRALTALEDQSTVQRVIAGPSEEFQTLSDTFNAMLDSLRADIGRMKKLERIRSEFLGNVSHELRTPLFSTQGMIETLLNGAVNDKKVKRDFLKKALQNIERLNSLLEELIEISQIESGEMKLRLRYFDIVALLSSVVAEMQPLAKQRAVKLKLIGNEKKEIMVMGDKERLGRVLVNLIDNALKYSESKDTVRVKFSESTDSIEISVEDTGIGIAPQHLPRIFERFYRVDRDRSRDVGGTGLGLAIVKHIVEAHHSKIRVESEIGVGTRFSFGLKKSGND